MVVDAYLDKSLTKSMISKDKAEETNAEVTELRSLVHLKDDEGRRYICHFTISVRWYVRGKEKRTFAETFYRCETRGDADVPVRLCGNIEPLARPAIDQTVCMICAISSSPQGQSVCDILPRVASSKPGSQRADNR